MPTFRHCINEIKGLRFVYDTLELCSAFARKELLNKEFITDAVCIQSEINMLSNVQDYVQLKKNKESLDTIKHKLSEINEITATINNLTNNSVLDDIELYELKKFGLLSQVITSLCKETGLAVLSFHNLDKLVRILDPENKKIPSFYIYTAYDIRLKSLRKKYKELIKENKEKAEKTRLEYLLIEDEIRIKLSQKLSVYALKLTENLQNFAQLDILLAKAQLAVQFGFCKPVLTQNKTSYQALFNPQVKAVLQVKSKQFQPIDLSFTEAPILITGANMSGKTIVLKTVALAQYLAQFGFYVPAKKAHIVPVQEIILSIGDKQSETNGLSSFGVEMFQINNIIEKARKGIKILALVDELARTTNPDEGKSIVSAFISILTDLKASALITTHYSGVKGSCKKLRVKGLRINPDTETITIANINDFMDYSLIETTTTDVPLEALRIAEILGIDKELLQRSKGLLAKNNSENTI